MTGQVPRYLSDQFTTRIGVTGRITRSSQLLNIPLYKSNAGQRTFYWRIWNNLDTSLRADVSYFLPPAEKGRLRNGVANRVQQDTGTRLATPFPRRPFSAGGRK